MARLTTRRDYFGIQFPIYRVCIDLSRNCTLSCLYQQRYIGYPPPFKNEFDVLDISIPGPGRDKQPDAAWRPSRRPQNPPGNALAQLLPQQINGDPFPSLIL